MKRTVLGSRVVSRPFYDPEGRWRVGVGKKALVRTEARSRTELKDELLKIGIWTRII